MRKEHSQLQTSSLMKDDALYYCAVVRHHEYESKFFLRCTLFTHETCSPSRQWAGYEPWDGLILTEIVSARQIGCHLSFGSRGFALLFFPCIFFSRALELCCIGRPHRWRYTNPKEPQERVLALFIKGLKLHWLLCPRKEVYCCQDLLCSVLQTSCPYSARSLMLPAP